MEELLQKHRQEKKSLQANIQKIKQLVPKNDKKKKKESNHKIEEMETELKKTQAEELYQFNKSIIEATNSTQQNDEAVTKRLEQLDLNLEKNQLNFEQKQSQKISKAQKRREKKEKEQFEKEKRILEDEKNNVNHVRIIEINKLGKLLKENDLKLFDIPSDGDCMYKAIEHQLTLQGIKDYKVENLRKLTSNSLKKNKENYLPFLTSSINQDELMNDQEFENYCKDIELNRKWGGNLELQVISNELSANIHVYQADGPIIKFECKNPITNNPLLIGFHKYLYQLGAHYSSLLRISN